MASADVDCPVFCPSNYLPVCAQSEADGSLRTFSNQCALDFEICDKKESEFFDSFRLHKVLATNFFFYYRIHGCC